MIPATEAARRPSWRRKQKRDDGQYAGHFYLLDTNQRKLNLNTEAIHDAR
jgi:hypothetical protein